MDLSVVNHFKDLACVAQPSLCPTCQPNHAVVNPCVTTIETDSFVKIDRDTMDSTVVNNFRDLACVAHPGLCPTWQPNRAVVISILGVTTDNTDSLVSLL